jgi:hypothetical protein
LAAIFILVEWLFWWLFHLHTNKIISGAGVDRGQDISCGSRRLGGAGKEAAVLQYVCWLMGS